MQIWAIIYLYDCNRNKFSIEKLKSPPFLPPNLQATNILFCPAHISGSQQEADFADHHSLDDYLGNIFPKSSCDSQNIFLSSITHDFQSCAVTTRSAWWSPQALFTPLAVCVGICTRTHTHIQNGGGGIRSSEYRSPIYQAVHGCVVLPPTVREWNCVNNWLSGIFFFFFFFPVLDLET